MRCPLIPNRLLCNQNVHENSYFIARVAAFTIKVIASPGASAILAPVETQRKNEPSEYASRYLDH